MSIYVFLIAKACAHQQCLVMLFCKLIVPIEGHESQAPSEKVLRFVLSSYADCVGREA